MKPVDQTIFDEGRGNCLAACVASVLELPISEVPNFAELGFSDGLLIWLRERALGLIQVTLTGEISSSSLYWSYQEDHVILCGYSPRSDSSGKRKHHAVVGRLLGYQLKTEHDPHPSRDGLAGEPFKVYCIVRPPLPLETPK